MPNQDRSIAQIRLEDPEDWGLYPKLRVDCRDVQDGETFTALFPDG